MPPIVLCVDDCADHRFIVAAVLESYNCTIIEAATGKTALELIQQSPPAVILLDIALPDIDGVEIARQLKQNASTAAIPIVAITALSMPDDRDRILAAGVDEYIKKPCAIEDLESTVLRYLQTPLNSPR